MIAHKHRRSRFIQPSSRRATAWRSTILKVEPHSRHEQHRPFVRSCRRPLSETSISDDVEYRRRDAAIECADEHGDCAGQEAAIELESIVLEDPAKEEEGVDCRSQDGDECEQVKENGIHDGRG